MRSLMRGVFVILLGSTMFAQTASKSQKIEIALEREQAGQWKIVPAGLVFDHGDHLRFRVRTNFNGYLYVMNKGTSGEYVTLFPREETGLDNRVSSGKEYVIPSTASFFRVDGPAGFDVVYWLMSPTPIGKSDGSSGYIPLPPPPKGPVPPANMKPRCDETILEARSVCIDTSAGPRNINEDETLPSTLASIHTPRSRDLVILNQAHSSVIASPVKLTGPVLYEFRVAHQ